MVSRITHKIGRIIYFEYMYNFGLMCILVAVRHLFETTTTRHLFLTPNIYCMKHKVKETGKFGKCLSRLWKNSFKQRKQKQLSHVSEVVVHISIQLPKKSLLSLIYKVFYNIIEKKIIPQWFSGFS
jgi:hypothetical protein